MSKTLLHQEKSNWELIEGKAEYRMLKSREVSEYRALIQL